MTVQAGLCRTWSETPKTGFLASRLSYSFLHSDLNLQDSDGNVPSVSVLTLYLDVINELVMID